MWSHATSRTATFSPGLCYNSGGAVQGITGPVHRLRPESLRPWGLKLPNTGRNLINRRERGPVDDD